ncbi:nuclear transport factor 2 family protein [Histidinibacterium lentulum]|uniref:Nuclear transport factor 2 family protein n=1 Tax=Histidinibacterium lentulum TaxID=2480588 RepID=A0A3N2QYC9_9RHOB|nr:nuclear transport factor 2 family protein [Histidinibacterium lentulum]ROU00207.1 nuclear transport factor 2 family protein [Histidinibacterium lentulum]
MDELCEELLAAERVVWDALVTGDARADRTALDPGFLRVREDGFAGREDHVAQLATGPALRDYLLTDARAMAVGPDHGLLTYRARVTRVPGGAEEVLYVSSLWRRVGDGWVSLFSQDTRAVPS